jgi:hypothetical protein
MQQPMQQAFNTMPMQPTMQQQQQQQQQQMQMQQQQPQMMMGQQQGMPGMGMQMPGQMGMGQMPGMGASPQGMPQQGMMQVRRIFRAYALSRLCTTHAAPLHVCLLTALHLVSCSLQGMPGAAVPAYSAPAPAPAPAGGGNPFDMF